MFRASFYSRPVVVLLVFFTARPVAGLISVVTGANGYLGRALVHELLSCETDDDEIICLVRRQRVKSEEAYWEKYDPRKTIRVLPYNMLDGGISLEDALRSCKDTSSRVTTCVYHTASVFGPTENHEDTAFQNVQGTEDLVQILGKVGKCKLVLTSSMAAVRGTGQDPLNGKYYTSNDWNTVSELGVNWGASYQWSKAESERRAWDACKGLGVPMVALCPSFIFGPPFGSESSSYSLTLVNQWARGLSQVQSRLFVDVRDVAKAHVQAGQREQCIGKRYIVSTEERIPSQRIAKWLKAVCCKTQLSDPDLITFDADFTGGSIPIGSQEVESVEILRAELEVELRLIEDTISEMAEILLNEEQVV